ncbi:MAG: hypothetical protein QMD12_03655 [Candidatus Aenigmarchaeota archaeon]|nr:hypothetical protein [Candidatus Aenigmarchaeota archaeon]
MVLFTAGVLELGIALLLGTALAEYAKFRHKAEKGWAWIATAGVFMLFAGAFSAVPIVDTYLTFERYGLKDVFAVIGWLFALIGTLLVAYEVLLEK